jgi:hypothetical protein
MLTLLILALAVLFALPASAQDAPATPEPVDNLCDDGQLWDDGRCDIPGYPGASDLAWTCGWYMARIFDGRLSASALPRWCAHLITTGGGSGGVDELCREIAPGNILCFRSDQTGDLTVSGTPFIQYRFLPSNPGSAANCPAVPGLTALIVEATTVQLTRFSADELFIQLGLGPYYCLYVAVT